MSQVTLATLNLTPTEVTALSGRDRTRLLHFLLRWEYVDALHASLDALIDANPDLVSLLDLRVRALLAQGRPEAALPLMQRRLEMRDSMTARALEAQIYLAQGAADAARARAQALMDENPDKVTPRALLAEVHWALGNLDDAFALYRQLVERSPRSRSYLLGMVRVYQAREDWVTASGYATRLLRIAEEEGPLPVDTLRHLRAYFVASGEATRVADIDAELVHRQAEELAELQAHFAPPERAPAPPTVDLAAPPTAAPAPAVGDEIPVSDAERARIAEAVRRTFGFEALHPGQLETLACALRGEDVLAVLPTGGGKSLCYQLPALLDEAGTTLVISPLIALMKDQVESLPEAARAQATTLHSDLVGGELRRRMDQIAAGEFKLVYAAPERLRQTPFLHLMNAAEVSRLVVDEAHCVSVWGHDFRPDYLIIARARAALGNPPLIAVTATAPPRVRRDIVQQFGEMQVVVGDSTRPNLQYEVFHARNADEKLAHLLAFCTSVPGSGIVYAGTRKRCERLAALLRRYGVAAEHYHAGIPNRAAVQDAFMSGRTRVVVATIAFGMGIDKADVRFIVHYVPPDSLESYYQQAGRAGRDGQPSRCLLMYSSSDRGTLTRHAREGVLPVEYLRGVYGAVKQQLNGQDLGVLNAEMLTRALNSNDIDVRVALSLLEEAELLYRGPDLPRNVRVTLLASPPPPALAPYAEALGLLTPTRTTLPIARVVEQTDLTLDSAEAALLRWADAGWIDYDPDRRDVALRLLPPPDDAAERVAVLLERHETIQGQRVDEISAYAETGRCRHGYINAYLGGAPVAQCTACDNCVRIPPPPDPGLPTEREQLQAILRLLANTHGWGRGSITSIMIGDVERAPDAGRRRKDFGRLAFRSRSAIGKLVRRLEKGGFLKSETLSHGGVAYAITARGRAALETPAKLDRLTRQRRPPKRPPRKMEPVGQRTLSGETVPVEAPPVDEELYETLRAWRNDLARQKHIPAYVIFANKTLTAIAAHKPETPGALERIKGVGPKKLARYGETVIQLVKHHRAQTPDPAP